MILLVLLYQCDTQIPRLSREVRSQGLLQNITSGTEGTCTGWRFKPVDLLRLYVKHLRNKLSLF